MRNKNSRKDGVAMIMVLVMIIIFASLILAVVISSTTAIRRAHFYKDKNTALQIAIAGIQEVLYRMNYSQYETGSYPFGTGNNPEQIPFPGGGQAVLSLDSSCETKIISQGTYRGRTAQVSVYIKGDNHTHTGVLLKPSVSSPDSPYIGIPEAFNKHVIYAKTVNFTGTPPTGISIKGNVTAEAIVNKPSSPPLEEATWTETTINLSDMVHFETSIYSFTFTIPAYSGEDDLYTNTGKLINATYPSPGIDVNGSPDPTPGIYWDALNNRYLLGIADDGTTAENFNSNGRRIRFEADVLIKDTAGNITLDSYLQTTGSLTINKGIDTPTDDADFCLDAAGSLTIASGITIDGDLVVRGQALTLSNNILGKVLCNEDITVNGGSINGSVMTQKDIQVNGGSINGSVLSNKSIAVSGGTINGSVLCYGATPANHTISISGGTIDATNSDYDAAVYIHNSASGSGGVINISGSPTITLGENQRAGIAIVAPNGTVNISSPFTLNYASGTPEQFAIVNWSNTGNVNVTANNLILRGSIYSYDTITLNDSTQTITGILVAGNVGIGNNSKIIYDPEPYKQNSQVYKGFSWGRRRYVPVPGSWQIRW